MKKIILSLSFSLLSALSAITIEEIQVDFYERAQGIQGIMQIFSEKDQELRGAQPFIDTLAEEERCKIISYASCLSGLLSEITTIHNAIITRIPDLLKNLVHQLTQENLDAYKAGFFPLLEQFDNLRDEIVETEKEEAALSLLLERYRNLSHVAPILWAQCYTYQCTLALHGLKS